MGSGQLVKTRCRKQASLPQASFDILRTGRDLRLTQAVRALAMALLQNMSCIVPDGAENALCDNRRHPLLSAQTSYRGGHPPLSRKE